MSFVELKRNAKDSLKGKYGEVIKLLLLSFVVAYAVSFGLGFISAILDLSDSIISLLDFIASLVVNGCIGFGYASFFLKISRNEEVTSDELFKKHDLAVLYISISVLVGIFTFLWSLLFIIPGIIAAISYTFVYCVSLDNPELGAMDVLKKCKEIMHGHKFDFFILTLSFLGWIILGLFTLGILYLWLIPYMQVTYANFYNEIIK